MGLRINLTKCTAIVNPYTDIHCHTPNVRVCQPVPTILPGQTARVLGCMLGWGVPSALLSATMLAWLPSVAPACWSSKLRLLDCTVGACLLWAAPIWHYSKFLVARLVTLAMSAWHRGSCTSARLEIRSRRLVKHTLHEQNYDLWGISYLKCCWNYAGHLARADCNPAAVLRTRDLRPGGTKTGHTLEDSRLQGWTKSSKSSSTNMFGMHRGKTSLNVEARGTVSNLSGPPMPPHPCPLWQTISSLAFPLFADIPA